MTVEGKITRTHNSSKACFLNFHNNFTRYFSLVIFASAFKRFPDRPEEFYLDKFVRVKGKIKPYEGKPEIIVNSPKQIKIIGTK
jgi:micrococcal nuclease